LLIILHKFPSTAHCSTASFKRQAPPSTTPAHLSNGAWTVQSTHAQLLEHSSSKSKHGKTAVEQLIGLQGGVPVDALQQAGNKDIINLLSFAPFINLLSFAPFKSSN
jgi:hypothetical protein